MEGFPEINKNSAYRTARIQGTPDMVWSKAVSAWAVDRRLRQPNWQLSREGTMTDKSHWPTIDSNTLDLETIGSRDIGLGCSCWRVCFRHWYNLD